MTTTRESKTDEYYAKSDEQHRIGKMVNGPTSFKTISNSIQLSTRCFNSALFIGFFQYNKFLIC